MAKTCRKSEVGFGVQGRDGHAELALEPFPLGRSPANTPASLIGICRISFLLRAVFLLGEAVVAASTARRTARWPKNLTTFQCRNRGQTDRKYIARGDQELIDDGEVLPRLHFSLEQQPMRKQKGPGMTRAEIAFVASEKPGPDRTIRKPKQFKLY
jgi:hypothetical protein